ncbi:MAG TPA: chromosomal replication initiator DnaA [Candidatus Sulfotelmatobacter sp.]|jgi:chromosomal replication initiation ATPase DnaA|nr:chromosomal replication initiator DnaA [Candidatus Sulfotelmatobacter sp.]
MVQHRQIPMDFGHEPAFAEDDFLVTDCNAEAHGWIMRWPAWPSFALALSGPAASGKSHLAHVFAARSGGAVIAAPALTVDGVPALADHGAVAIEDADQGVDETALFHLHNLLRETKGWLLLTGREAPARWPMVLPDLRSRLSALPVAAIGAPDDALLQALLLKLFSDRQLRVSPDILTYLLPRMERSFHAARVLVERIDSAALALKRPITIPFLRDLLPEQTLDP